MLHTAAYAVERNLAVNAARTAARLCERVRQTLSDTNSRNNNNNNNSSNTNTNNQYVMTKNDQSPVTVADLGAQAIICRAIRSVFPHDPIVAEEDATALRSSTLPHYCWEEVKSVV